MKRSAQLQPIPAIRRIRTALRPAAAALALALVLAPSAWAASFTWNGGGTDNNWNTADNWVGAVAPGVAGDALIFTGNVRPTSSNDLPAPAVNSIAFAAAAAAFTLTGNTASISGGINNGSAATQTVNMLNLSLAGDQTITNTNAGALVFGATGNEFRLTNTPTVLTFDGNGATTILSHMVESGGGIGSSIVKQGTGSLTLTGTAAHTGGTTVNNGSLIVDGTGRINGGNLNVGMLASDDATVLIQNGGRADSNDVLLGDVTNSTGRVTVRGAGSQWNVSGTMQISGSSMFSAGNGHLTLESGGTVTVGGGGGTLTLGSGDAKLNIGAEDLNSPTAGGTLNAAAIAYNSSFPVINFNQTDTVSFGAAIANWIRVNQRGSGTSILTATHDGLTSVLGGTLEVAASGTISGDVGVTGVGGLLRVNGNVGGDVDVWADAALAGTGGVTGTATIGGPSAKLAPGNNAAGVLTVGRLLLLDDAAILEFELGAASDRIQVNGDLTLDGVLNVAALASFGAGTYRLIDYTGALTNNNLRLGSLPAGYSASIAVDAVLKRVDLVVVSTAAPDPDPPRPSVIVPTPGVPVTLTDTTPVTATPGSILVIPPDANVAGIAITLAGSGGNESGPIVIRIGSLTLTLIGYTPGTVVSFKKVKVGGVDTLVLVIVGGDLVLGGGSGQPLLTINGTATLTAGTDDTRIRFSAAAAGDGSGHIAVVRGHIVLTANAFAERPQGPALPADGKVYAGEVARFGADGKIVQVRLGSPPGETGQAGDPLTLNLAPSLSFATTIPQLDGHAARLGRNVLEVLATAAGATLAGGQTNGVVALDIGATRIHALPLGEIVIDATQADGAKLGADGTATVAVGGVVARFAPIVADLGQLARDVAGPFPWPGIEVTADGVLVANIVGTRYALRPGWVAEVAAGETESERFAAESESELRYRRDGYAHKLSAAVADWGSFAAAVAAGLPGATVRTNADGTVSIEYPSQRLRLKPEMALETAPAGTGAWWVEADGRLMLRNADGSAQGFQVE